MNTFQHVSSYDNIMNFYQFRSNIPVYIPMLLTLNYPYKINVLNEVYNHQITVSIQEGNDT